MSKEKPLFNFQKDYWLGGSFSKSPEIDTISFDIVKERKRKIFKLVDKINGVEHKYIENDIEYFNRILIESTGIPLKYFTENN